MDYVQVDNNLALAIIYLSLVIIKLAQPVDH